MANRILVLGATGLLGKPAAWKLREDGFEVRIMARDIENAELVFGEGFDIVHGDVTDMASLERAMSGCEGVHISVGGPVDQVSAENTAVLAPKLGIRRITYISGATVVPDNGWFPMVAQKLAAEKAIMECGVAYTVFCPTWPMEQIARFSRDGSPFMIGRQPHPIHFFAETDLARMISAAYQNDETAGRRFHVYGPEAMTMQQAILSYCAVFHPNVDKVQVMPVWLAKLIAAITGNDSMKFAANLLGYFNRTPEVGDSREANRILGTPQITLEAWMQSSWEV